MTPTRRARICLSLLLAWMLSFQALASVGAIPCAHSSPMPPMAGMDMPSLHHACKTPAAPTKSTCCGCVGQCQMSAPMLAAPFVGLSIPQDFSPPVFASLPTALASGHGRDLLRPPSIS